MSTAPTSEPDTAEYGLPKGQFGKPLHTILHISDTHFVESGELLYDTIDSDANLARLFQGLKKSSIRPDALVFTGDMADTGAPDAYARLRALVEPVCRHYGAQLIWLMGNHDSRPEFRRGLLDLEPTQESVDQVFDIGGLRLIGLDSTVPGHHYGEITDEQLDWLADQLRTPAEHGTLIGLHHPPLPSPLGLGVLIELRDQERLERVVAGTDVRAILGGHFHYTSHATFAGGIPVSVASATCYTEDLNAIYPNARGVNGAQSYNLVHVYSDRVLHSVVPIGSFPTVHELTPEILKAFAERTKEGQAKMIGRADATEDVETILAD
ncbi:phosphodiesterase [Brevibacterium sp. 50QC2O2]|uniref:phosphodiesterase n=1 Tax=Brevibacterium sp. 50QC2O2 TaxID=2968459 RepID=UPI00211C80D5|nr:phosphodiesterase [Brevibacterium sp. 50QC2O2]MCQ9388212.1 phosphodiesterase [Brevibacterium sp. 50QC2O2]